MTNQAVLSSLCLSALLTASLVTAQTPIQPSETATEEAVKMQARVLEARNRVAEARASEARLETLAASQQYNKALELVQGIGTIADGVRQEAMAGLARTSLTLADQAMKRNDYAEAKLQIDRVLKVDPRNKKALEMRALNNQLIAESIDKTPHQSSIDTLASTETNRVEIGKLIQDGKLYYETGRLLKAEEALRAAIKMNPDNQAAAYYLDLVYARKYSAETRLREVNSKQMLLEVEEQWADPVTRQLLQVPNPYARTNLVHTSSERQTIFSKLRRIRLNEWGPIDNLPLSEVIRNLDTEARRRDSDKEDPGINFILSPNADSAGGAAAGAGAPGVDAAGLPVAAAPEPTDLNGIQVRLGTQLKNVTLEQALNILMNLTDRKIKFSVEDYGILISPKANEPVPLHTRFYKLDPNTFQQGLQNVVSLNFGESQNNTSGGGNGGGGGGGGNRGGGGGGGGNRGGGGGNNNNGGNNQNGQNQGGGANYAGVSIAPTGNQQGQGGVNRAQGGAGQPGGAAGGAAAQQQGGGISFLTAVTPSEIVIPTVKNFFLTAGVDLTTAGKAVFFNDRLGVLLVRATLQDLDTIEKAIHMLNMAPPQLTIRAKFMEVGQDDVRALGFDWYLGNTLMNKGAIGAQGGTAPSYYVPGPNGSSSAANPGGYFPGPSGVPGVPGPGAIPGSPSDNLITSGLRSGAGNGVVAPTIATVTGILTDPQFRFVVKALEQRSGTDLLSAPEITTMSGRQAQIKVVNIEYIVTSLDVNQTSAGGGASGVTGVNASGGGIGTTIQPFAEPFELGPVLDVVPYVNADGYTIQLTILPTLKEFLGYDTVPQFDTQAQGAGATGNNQAALTATTPLPRFRLRQVATTAMVWDGQTVVLGGLISEDVVKQQDKVPMLGDMPWLGRFFRSEFNITHKKNLVIFVTPTLIDPAGNRLHSEEEMPFAQNSIPRQPLTINQ